MIPKVLANKNTNDIFLTVTYLSDLYLCESVRKSGVPI